MLSRTADHLYWMARYTERAESLARLVDAHYRMSLLPQLGRRARRVLARDARGARHRGALPRAPRRDRVSRGVRVRGAGPDFGGSIVDCLRAARENARAVRGSLTSELWVTLNSTWLDARALAARRSAGADIGHFVEWVKERSHLTRGVTSGTMLRDEALHFTRIGTFIERADNSARILQAHQRDLVPGADAGSVPDPYEWSALLRALSAFEVYRRVYRDVITPFKVAELLILCDDMPRSLLRCCKDVYENLRSIANERSAETVRRAGEMHAMLHFSRMEDIMTIGLPRFLERFLARACDLGDRIASDFLVPPTEA